MRRLAWCAALIVLVASCGSGSEPTSSTSEPRSSTAVETTVTTTTIAPQPSTTTTTWPPVVARWSVAELGRSLTRALGSTVALGSGCSPGSDDLPDGVWFGWIAGLDDDAIEFDLACLWPGRLEPAASNDASRIRVVEVDAGALVYLSDQAVRYSTWAADGNGALTAAANAPGLPATLPFWVFINGGVVTEIAQQQPIHWAKTASAWPGITPGCCDGGTIAPPSPVGALPANGWPADGFYGATVSDVSGTQLQLGLHQWFSCRDRPDLCPPWWTGDEVSGEPEAQPLERTVALDENLSVVILPILDETPIVGDGRALGSLLTDIEGLRNEFDGYRETLTVDEWRDRSADPAFPFGPADPSSTYVLDLIGYRGPGGTYLMMPWSDLTVVGSFWWPAVEIRDGQPILNLHAGLFAG